MMMMVLVEKMRTKRKEVKSLEIIKCGGSQRVVDGRSGSDGAMATTTANGQLFVPWQVTVSLILRRWSD